MVRTTKDLIDDLEAEGGRFTALFLVCRFATDTGYTEHVEHSEADKLDKLNDIVARGGTPFAMIGYLKKDESGPVLNVHSRLLKECEEDDEALRFLQRALPTIAERVQESGLTPKYLPTGEWLEQTTASAKNTTMTG